MTGRFALLSNAGNGAPMKNGSKFVVGVPNEIKTHESRVALTPVGVEELTRQGNRVLIQSGAG